MITISKKTIAVSTSALLLVGGAAYAAWTVSGSGTGSAGTATAVNVSFNDSSVSDLWPNIPRTVTVHYNNTNPGPVQVSDLKVTVTGAPALCTFTYGDATGGPFTIPTQSGDLTFGQNQTAPTVTLTSDDPACETLNGLVLHVNPA